MRLLAYALAAAAALSPSELLAVSAPVSGRVVDNGGHAVAGALVSLVELHRAATTDRDGSFRFGDVPSGRYTISARHIGLISAAKEIVVETSPVNVSLTLDQRPTRIEPVNVTALRVPVADGDSPLPTSVLSSDEVHAAGGVSLAHSIASLPGVRNVSTGQEIGKPMIRGLFGPRILVLTDGSRLEDYSWSDEDGPSLDARIADRIEVIRGPASVLYGSEALGGVVNVIPAPLSFSSDGSRQQRGAIEAYGGSNNIELGSALMAEGAQSKYAWRVIGTGRFSQNYRTPTGEEPNSSFWAFNGEGAFGIRGDRSNTTFRAAHYGGEFHLLESTGPEVGDPEGGPVRQVMDDRLQATNDFVARGLRFETKAQFQRHSLAEVSDDCVPVPPATTCQKVKDQQAFGLVLNTGTVDAMVHHGGGDGLSGTVGVSGMYQSSSSSGPIFIVPSATIGSVGAFALEQFTTGPVSFTAGARADTRSLSSDAQSEIGRASDSRSWSAVSGDAGVIFHITPQLSALANAATGWRAPTLFDLYANGPNLAEARFEVGDPTMETERSKTIDGGFRWASDRARAEVSVYRSDVDNFIFTTPTSTTQNGLQIFRHTQADARLTGAELSLEARVTDQLVLRASHDLTNGDDLAAGVPLPLMPPQRTILGGEIDLPSAGALRSVRLGGDVEINQKQTRLNPEDLATGGYSLLNLDVSFEHSLRGQPGRFDILVRNALNTTYRDFLSRFKGFANGPGVNLIFKVSAGTW
jgi:outer membrane receptor protein involved in Fe transport